SPRRPRYDSGRRLARVLVLALAVQLAEAARSLDRRPEVQPLVLGLFDQHHGLDRVHVVDPLFATLRGNLSLVRPVVELHLRDACDLANLTQVELDLVQMLRKIDWL